MSVISEKDAINQLTILFDQFIDQFMQGRKPDMLDFGRLERDTKLILLQVGPPAVAEAYSKILNNMVVRLGLQTLDN